MRSSTQRKYNSTFWPMLCFQLKINRVFCSISSWENSWRRECGVRGTFENILEGIGIGPSREMRYAACPRARFDLSNKNNIQLKGNNTLGLIFIATILHIEPFGHFSVRKFLMYSFLYNSELILYRMFVCSSVLVPRHAAAAAVDHAVTQCLILFRSFRIVYAILSMYIACHNIQHD